MRNVYDYSSEEDRFRVEGFLLLWISLYKRSQKAEKVNSMFSFIWNPTTDGNDSNVSKAADLSSFIQMI